MFPAQALKSNCYPGCPAVLEGNEDLANSQISFNTDFANLKQATFSFYFRIFNEGDLRVLGVFDPNQGTYWHCNGQKNCSDDGYYSEWLNQRFLGQPFDEKSSFLNINMNLDL